MAKSNSITNTVGYAAALASVVASCAAVPPQVERWQAAPVGASWETAQRNTGSYGKDALSKVTVREGTWKGSPAVALAMESGGTLLQQPSDGKWIALLGRDGQPAITWDPPNGFPYPLRLGNSWTSHQRMTVVASGKITEWDSSCNVAGYEKVTVQAGTYDAFRIQCTNTLGGEDTYWLSPSVHPFLKTKLKRNEGHPSGPGTQEAELVRAPS
jgi:hypothetical protein